MFNDRQTFPNLYENLYLMWLMSFFNLDILKGKSIKSIWIITHVKLSKNMLLGPKKIEKKTKIVTNMDLWKYGQILTIQKSLIIKWLRFLKKRFLIWIYHFILRHILSPNNKFGIESTLFFSFCDVLFKWPIHIFRFQKSITTNNWIF
jgi:hypothetical protein